MSTVINIISGKGGTGKTLLTAVLAEMLGDKGIRVLTIDLDVFVRGLTTLLYFQKGEMIRIVDKNANPVSYYFNKNGVWKENCNELAICRYRSFDVAPAVRTVDEILSFKDLMPDTSSDAKYILKKILDQVQDEYEVILLDSRAGYDELISATHEVSDCSLCVEEDDNISIVTTDNLIAQLKVDSDKPIFRIKNKARGYSRDNMAKTLGIMHIGSIPFDADVMKSFGTENFWAEINRSVYKEALCVAWNELSRKMGLGNELKFYRVSPVGSIKIERRLTELSSLRRISFLYGAILGVLGVYLMTEGNDAIRYLLEDPVRVLGMFATIVGLSAMLLSIMSKEK